MSPWCPSRVRLTPAHAICRWICGAADTRQEGCQLQAHHCQPKAAQCTSARRVAPKHPGAATAAAAAQTRRKPHALHPLPQPPPLLSEVATHDVKPRSLQPYAQPLLFPVPLPSPPPPPTHIVCALARRVLRRQLAHHLPRVVELLQQRAAVALGEARHLLVGVEEGLALLAAGGEGRGQTGKGVAAQGRQESGEGMTQNVLSSCSHRAVRWYLGSIPGD